MRGFPIVEPIDEPYWPVRIMRGGDVLIPKDDHHIAQLTDIVSLAEFMVHCGENQITGAFSIAHNSFRFEDYLEDLLEVTGSNVTFQALSQEVLEGYGVQPYRDLPLWRPKPEGAYHFNISKAKAAGLKNRSLKALFKDQLAGYLSRNPNDDFEFGHPGTISIALEKEILKDWLSRKIKY